MSNLAQHSYLVEHVPVLATPLTFASLPPGSAADLSEAEPTLTHMSIARLHEQKLVRAQGG